MKAFFDHIRPMFGALTDAQVKGIEAILDAWAKYADRRDVRDLAYMLATAHHETGRKFTAVVENLNYTTAARIKAVWPSRFKTLAAAQPFVKNPRALANKVYGGRLGNTGPNDGWTYRGRGLAQITGKALYSKLSRILGVDLVVNPEQATDVTVAARILVVGLSQGLFTGKKLADYLTSNATDFVGARACVNADTAANGKTIAKYAETYLAALRAQGAILQTSAEPTPVAPPVEEHEEAIAPIFPKPNLWQLIIDFFLNLLPKGR